MRITKSKRLAVENGDFRNTSMNVKATTFQQKRKKNYSTDNIRILVNLVQIFIFAIYKHELEMNVEVNMKHGKYET